VVGRTKAHRCRLSMMMSFSGRGTTALQVDTDPPMVRFGGGGPMDHGEAFGGSYVARGGPRVAIDGEPFVDSEAADDELALGSLAEGLSSIRVLHAEDVEGVLLADFDGNGRDGRWLVMVVLLAWRRVKQSSGGVT
jgi:hypothetical protein